MPDPPDSRQPGIGDGRPATSGPGRRRARRPESLLFSRRMFVAWAAVFVLAMVADFVTTYHRTPDLADEANPLFTSAPEHVRGWALLLVLKPALSLPWLALMFFEAKDLAGRYPRPGLMGPVAFWSSFGRARASPEGPCRGRRVPLGHFFVSGLALFSGAAAVSNWRGWVQSDGDRLAFYAAFVGPAILSGYVLIWLDYLVTVPAARPARAGRRTAARSANPVVPAALAGGPGETAA